jgi:hypothetical protein
MKRPYSRVATATAPDDTGVCAARLAGTWQVVADEVYVELPRVADRDRVLEALAQRGHEARPAEEDGWPAIEVPCDGDADTACADLVGELEALVGELDVPLVPVRGEGVVYLRPPAG